MRFSGDPISPFAQNPANSSFPEYSSFPANYPSFPPHSLNAAASTSASSVATPSIHLSKSPNNASSPPLDALGSPSNVSTATSRSSGYSSSSPSLPVYPGAALALTMNSSYTMNPHAAAAAMNVSAPGFSSMMPASLCARDQNAASAYYRYDNLDEMIV